MAVALSAAPAFAQFNGENLLGDVGIKSGTQPEPGLYLGNVYYRYRTETIRGKNGNKLTFDPTGEGGQTIQAAVPLAIYVTKWKLFGANVGMMAVMPFGNGALEAPGLGILEEASTGASDAYFVPFQLGWHTKRADITTGVGFFAPTGRYEADASDNIGKGMWSYELQAGSTVYLDQARTWSAAATAYYETHTRKKDTPITVGDLLTVEGGVGKSYMHGAMSLGMAYYAQWKMTRDQVGLTHELPADIAIAKHRVYAIGPDVTIPIGTKSKLISLLNVRYLWEVGARVKTEGSSLVVTATLPTPSVRIPGR